MDRQTFDEGTTLRGLDGARVVIALVGRQFPGHAPGPGPYGDGNWLRVGLNVDRLHDSWQNADPCLSISNAEWIANWLEQISNGREVEPRLEFLEPNLSFELLTRTQGTATVRIYFELESRPDWASCTRAWQRDLWVDLEITFADLKAAAQSLRDQLAEVLSR